MAEIYRKRRKGRLCNLCEMIVGYGWLKSKGIKDPFYVLGKDVAYLSEFFAVEAFHGRNIYPAMISKPIESAVQNNGFFISAYTGNQSSLRGLTKVGFMPGKTLVFKRAFKMTLNKYKII